MASLDAVNNLEQLLSQVRGVKFIQPQRPDEGFGASLWARLDPETSPTHQSQCCSDVGISCSAHSKPALFTTCAGPALGLTCRTRTGYMLHDVPTLNWPCVQQAYMASLGWHHMQHGLCIGPQCHVKQVYPVQPYVPHAARPSPGLGLMLHTKSVQDSWNHTVGLQGNIFDNFAISLE